MRTFAKISKNEVLTEIYSTYITDAILPHCEQVKVENGGKSASSAILSNLTEYLPHIDSPKILDIGTGAGGMLRSFNEIYKKPQLFAYDVNDHNASILAQIPNFKRLYCDFKIDKI